MAETFDVKLVEEAKYDTPPPECKEKAYVRDYDRTYQAFVKDPEKFWDGIARELHWFAPWKKVLDWNYPYAKWFVDGKLNITYNCLDRHVYNHQKNKVAFIRRGGSGVNGSMKLENVFQIKKYKEG